MRSVRSKRGARAYRRGWAKTGVLRPAARSGFSRRSRSRGRTGWADAVGVRVRRRPVLLVAFVLLVAASVLGLGAGGHIGNAYGAFARSTGDTFAGLGFAVARVTLKGNERTSPDAIFAALDARQGDSIFGFDPADARARLLALPWVAEAEVRRHFPATISVVVIEKRPFARWQRAKTTAVIERSGAIIPTVEGPDFVRLPLVTGAGAPQAAASLIDTLGAFRAVTARLKAAERVSQRRWNLILTGDVVVKLPEEGWAREINELEHLIVDKGLLERRVEVIDLRYPDSYIFRLQNGDSHPVPRERRA